MSTPATVIVPVTWVPVWVRTHVIVAVPPAVVPSTAPVESVAVPVQVPANEAGVELVGFLRFVSDSSQSIAFKAGILQSDADVVHARSLTKKDLIDGAFFIGGAVRATVPGDGVYGFALYGHAPGLRVAWSAATQAIV